MDRPQRFWLMAIFGLLLLVVLDRSAEWFGGVVVGEYRDSPDGRFTAHVGLASRGTLLRGREPRIEMYVVDSKADAEVWRGEFRPSSNDAMPEYGDRAKKHIAWATDSSTVEFTIGVDSTVNVDLSTQTQ